MREAQGGHEEEHPTEDGVPGDRGQRGGVCRGDRERRTVAYLQAASEYERESITALLTPGQSPQDAVRAVAGAIVGQIQNPAFRGCAFLNAAAEYPDVDHAVHRAILEHRAWFSDLALTLFRAVTEDTADDSAELFVLLRDGVMTAGCLTDPRRAGKVFLNGVELVLAAAGKP